MLIDDTRQIAIIWSIEDVFTQAKERGITITDEQAFTILQIMKKQHDRSISITWDTIDCYLEEME